MGKKKGIMESEWKEELTGIEVEKTIEITDIERKWYWKNKAEWVAIHLALKDLYQPKNPEKMKEAMKQRNRIRQRDRAFLHSHLPKSIFSWKQIDHAWKDRESAEYSSCRLVDEEENQLKEKSKLEKEGWDVSSLVKELKEMVSVDWQEMNQNAWVVVTLRKGDGKR